VLSVRELCGTIGRSFRLEGVSFTVGPGERVAVLGPNGSGKSFLLRLILGLATPRAGTISWSDEVLSEGGRVRVPPEARSMGVVFQEGALFPHLDVRRNVELALPRTLGAAARREQVDRALEVARIHALRDRAVQALSGGEQQRVALARALVQRPRVLLLDEPFHSLDGPLKRAVLAEVRTMVEDRDVATVLVTHDTDEAASFADRVVFLLGGRMVQEGTFEDLYSRPADRVAAEFLGPVETLELAAVRDAGIELPREHDGPTVVFRPEHLELTTLDGGDDRGLEVVEVSHQGAFQRVVVALPDGRSLTSKAGTGVSWERGQRVSARIARTLSWPGRDEAVT
jgi:iron(III) transport system ATP-binding protein